MPMPLSNRLVELENQINYFLATQNLGSTCKLIRGKSVSRNADGNIEQIEFEGTTCSPKTCKSANVRPATAPSSRKDRSDRSRDSVQRSNRKISYSFDLLQDVCPCEYESPCVCCQPETPDLKKCTCQTKPKRDSHSRRRSRQKDEPSTPKQTSDIGEKPASIDQPTDKPAEEPTKSPTEKPADLSTEKPADLSTEKSAEKPEEKPEKPPEKSPDKPANKVGDGGADAAKKKTGEENIKKLAEYEALLTNQRKKLQEMEVQLKETQKAKQVALNSANQLKSKYDKLHSGKEGDALSKVKKEIEELTKKLDVENKLRVSLEKSANKAVEKEKKELTETVEKMESQASKSAKKMKKHSDILSSTVKQKDDHIRRLSGTSGKLADSIMEKELEHKKLATAHGEAVHNYLEAQTANKNLSDTNSILLKSIKEFEDKLNCEKNFVQKMQKQIAACKAESQEYNDEIVRLKERLNEALQGPKSISNAVKLQEKLEESREREKRANAEAEYLEKQMGALTAGQEEERRKSQDELTRLTEEHRKLEIKYKQIVEVLQKTKKDYELKIQGMKEDFERYAMESDRKENQLIKETDTLQDEFDRLVEDSQRNRAHIEELIVLVGKHDDTLDEHKGTLDLRNKTIEKLEGEIDGIMDNIEDLDKEIQSLQTVLGSAQSASQNTERDIGDLKSQLQRDKETLVLEAKKVQDQLNTIQTLNSSVGNHQSKLQSAMEELRIAKDESKTVREKLNNTTTQLSTEKEKAQLLVTEKIQLVSGDSVIQEKIGKVDKILSKFCKCSGDENKLAKFYAQKTDLLKKEAMLQIQLVEKQKEHAVQTARFATDRLLETTSDFQSQIETHKKMQLMLTRLLQEKESQLKRRAGKECYCSGGRKKRSSNKIHPCACGIDETTE